MAREQLEWIAVDTSTLAQSNADLQVAWNTLGQAKRAFEQAMQKQAGCDLAFSYKHGGLSVAKVAPKRAKVVSVAQLSFK